MPMADSGRCESTRKKHILFSTGHLSCDQSCTQPISISFTVGPELSGTAYVWKEVVLALIGEQFDEALADGDEICGFTVSIRQHDNIIRVWNTNASAHSTGLLDRLKAIIPKVEIRSPYYKANQEHTGFSKEFFEKAAKKATD